MSLDRQLRDLLDDALRAQLPLIRAEVEAVVRHELDAAQVGGAHGAAGDLMTPTEAARVAGVTAETVRRWVRRGRLADHGVGRGVRVRRAELRALNDPAPPSVEDFDLQARVDELLRRDAT